MNKGLTVLSLFDGISMGRLALERAGIEVDTYYAAEIDKYAIKVSEANYPDIIRLGDVCGVKAEDLPKIDILIGGSPCQSFSNAGDGSGFDGSSKLFWEYVRILEETKPEYFLLENVHMKKEWEDVITKAVGVEPIKINSGLLSAQNRPRIYWTNIPGVEQPEDLGLVVKDIMVEDDEVTDNMYLSEKAMAYMSRLRNGKPRWEFHKNPLDGKASCLTANMYKGVPYGVLKLDYPRRLTPVECERLQTLPDGYTKAVSNTQRYKCIGNGWTVSVIEHIFKGLIECESVEDEPQYIRPFGDGRLLVEFGKGGIGISDLVDTNYGTAHGVALVTQLKGKTKEHIHLVFECPMYLDKFIKRLEQTKERMIHG